MTKENNQSQPFGPGGIPVMVIGPAAAIQPGARLPVAASFVTETTLLGIREKRPVNSTITETRIKAIDFLFPYSNSTCIIGPPASGKTVLMTDLVTLPGQQDHIVFVPMGARTSEITERYQMFYNRGLIDKTTIVDASAANYPHAQRIGFLTAASMVEKLLEDPRDNVHLFIESPPNVFSLFDAIASDFPEFATVQEENRARLFSLLTNPRVNVTRVISAASDFLGSPEYWEQRKLYDNVIVLNHQKAGSAMFPAIDFQWSASKSTTVEAVGQDHAEMAKQARELLSWYQNVRPYTMHPAMRNDPILGVKIKRAERLEAYLTQYSPASAATDPSWSDKPMPVVPLVDTLEGIRAILAGEFDGVPVKKLLYILKIAEARAAKEESSVQLEKVLGLPKSELQKLFRADIEKLDELSTPRYLVDHYRARYFLDNTEIGYARLVADPSRQELYWTRFYPFRPLPQPDERPKGRLDKFENLKRNKIGTLAYIQTMLELVRRYPGQFDQYIVTQTTKGVDREHGMPEFLDSLGIDRNGAVPIAEYIKNLKEKGRALGFNFDDDNPQNQ